MHSDDENQSATQFIQNYADAHGLPQTAAPRGHNKPAPIYLPCHPTKMMVHGLFMKSGGSMYYISFTRVWTTACADIIITKPREDVCGTCAQFQSQISRAVTEEDRLTITESLKIHVTTAMDARDHYGACIARAMVAEAEARDRQANTHVFPYDIRLSAAGDNSTSCSSGWPPLFPGSEEGAVVWDCK